MGGSACLVAGAGAALAGCSAGKSGGSSTQHVVGASDINFTAETDALIIGTGIAGLAAGIPLAKAGKKVTYVEKLSLYGGESKISCGFMQYFGTKYQIQNGLSTTADEYWEKYKSVITVSKLYKESWYPEWIKRRFFGSNNFADAATEMGATWQKIASPTVTDLYTSVVLPKDGIGNPTSILEPVRAGLEKQGCKFMYSTKATALIKDKSGAVIGLRCQDQLTGENIDIKASKIAICTGGFSCNQEMISKYLPEFAPIGNITANSMGEGQLLGFAAGAQEYGMQNAAYMMGSIPQATTWGYFAPMMLVLPNGKRFINEGQSHDSGEAAIAAGFDGWWVIFDDTAWNTEPIAASVKANVASNPDRYVTASNIQDLAVGMKVDPTALAATYKNYNAMAASGTDTEFKKTRHLEPLSGTLYALRLTTRRYKTLGGFLTSVDSEVFDNNNTAIPNLYAAGSCVPWSGSDLSPNCGNGWMCGESMLAALKS